MRIEREKFLRVLSAVAPGLATREAVEQSSCFAFTGGRVHTFNDEVACSHEIDLGGLVGAVAAKPLLDLLGKLAEADVDVSVSEGGAELLVRGKNRRAGITLESEVRLPYSDIETPEKWRKCVDPAFAEAVSMAVPCASRDADKFTLTCVHITPTHVEACDNFQAIRYPCDTGFAKSVLVRAESLKHLAGLGMTECAATASWVHWRNPSGLVLSARRQEADYESLGVDRILEVPKKADSATWPGGLDEAIEKAEVFSSQNADNNVIIVELRPDPAPGVMRLRGVGAQGWYVESKKTKWRGKTIKFTIEPRLLRDIIQRTNECLIDGSRLVVAGKFTYVSCLGLPEDAK